MSAYVKKVRGMPVLTKEEELQLARSIQGKDALSEEMYDAIDKLLRANLYIVVQIALGIGRTDILDDLISEGNMALFESIQHFDPERNCKLCTFASHRIRSRMYKYLNRKEGEDVEVVSIVFDRAPNVHLELEDVLGKAVSTLSLQEQHILRMHFCEGQKLSNIGAAMRISGERVRQLQTGAVRKVRNYIRGGRA